MGAQVLIEECSAPVGEHVARAGWLVHEDANVLIALHIAIFGGVIAYRQPEGVAVPDEPDGGELRPSHGTVNREDSIAKAGGRQEGVDLLGWCRGGHSMLNFLQRRHGEIDGHSIRKDSTGARTSAGR